MIWDLKRFARDDSGATALEYGLILALISITILLAAGAISGNLQTMWDNISTRVAA